MKHIIVVGAGAAGLMAAVEAAKHGAQVTLCEKNNRIGKKLLITGKGRCNVTNTADLQEFIKNIPGNGRFLYSAFNRFFVDDTRMFFEEAGVPLKEERGGRIFPVSDKALDIVQAFMDKLVEYHVELKLDTAIKRILVDNGVAIGVETTAGEFLYGDAVVLATGGACYPGTGSTGDGQRMASQCGHTIVDLYPALVPLETDEEWIRELQGLSLKNVGVTVWVNNREAGYYFGEMLFTHYGVSGPIILSMSRDISCALRQGKAVDISINWKPALSTEQLDKRIQRDFIKYSKKQLKNSLGDLLPAKSISTIIDLACIDENKFINQITKEERERLVNILQNFYIHIVKTRPLTEAIVTGGGISLKEINPRTMESKVISKLYCIGEVIDIDAYTGGYNLQSAFSMGVVAAQSITIDA